MNWIRRRRLMFAGKEGLLFMASEQKRTTSDEEVDKILAELGIGGSPAPKAPSAAPQRASGSRAEKKPAAPAGQPAQPRPAKPPRNSPLPPGAGTVSVFRRLLRMRTPSRGTISGSTFPLLTTSNGTRMPRRPGALRKRRPLRPAASPAARPARRGQSLPRGPARPLPGGSRRPVRPGSPRRPEAMS